MASKFSDPPPPPPKVKNGRSRTPLSTLFNPGKRSAYLTSNSLKSRAERHASCPLLLSDSTKKLVKKPTNLIK